MQLVDLIPPSWNCPGIFGLPKGVGGMGWSGVVVVDGRVIQQNYAGSLAAAVIDVPFLMGNMGQESDQEPDIFVSNFTSDQWQNLLNQTYSPWDTVSPSSEVVVGEIIGQLYSQETDEGGPQKAFDSIVSDYGLGCPSIRIAFRALPPSGRFSSPLFVYSNWWNLTQPFLDVDDPHGHYLVRCDVVVINL